MNYLDKAQQENTVTITYCTLLKVSVRNALSGLALAVVMGADTAVAWVAVLAVDTAWDMAVAWVAVLAVDTAWDMAADMEWVMAVAWVVVMAADTAWVMAVAWEAALVVDTEEDMEWVAGEAEDVDVDTDAGGEKDQVAGVPGVNLGVKRKSGVVEARNTKTFQVKTFFRVRNLTSSKENVVAVI
jgi:hypothetical protein